MTERPGLDHALDLCRTAAVAVLMALADEMSLLTAICQKCHGVATRTQRVIDGKPAPWDSPLILVGGGDFYEARCPDCHEVPGRP